LPEFVPQDFAQPHQDLITCRMRSPVNASFIDASTSCA
jgi:hypothetical protein